MGAEWLTFEKVGVCGYILGVWKPKIRQRCEACGTVSLSCSLKLVKHRRTHFGGVKLSLVSTLQAVLKLRSCAFPEHVDASHGR